MIAAGNWLTWLGTLGGKLVDRSIRLSSSPASSPNKSYSGSSLSLGCREDDGWGIAFGFDLWTPSSLCCQSLLGFRSLVTEDSSKQTTINSSGSRRNSAKRNATYFFFSATSSSEGPLRIVALTNLRPSCSLKTLRTVWLLLTWGDLHILVTRGTVTEYGCKLLITCTTCFLQMLRTISLFLALVCCNSVGPIVIEWGTP